MVGLPALEMSQNVDNQPSSYGLQFQGSQCLRVRPVSCDQVSKLSGDLALPPFVPTPLPSPSPSPFPTRLSSSRPPLWRIADSNSPHDSLLGLPAPIPTSTSLRSCVQDHVWFRFRVSCVPGRTVFFTRLWDDGASLDGGHNCAFSH